MSPRLFGGRRLVPATVAAGLLLVALAIPAAAAGAGNVDLSGGCTLDLTALDASGATVGTASGPGAASPTDPFVVDPKGTVAWKAGTPALRNATYGVSVFSIPILSGAFASEGGASGTTDLSKIPAFDQFAGLVYVSGSARGDGGTCDGAVWVKLGGNPLTSIPGLGGMIVGGLGLIGVIGSLGGRHAFRGLGFGILLGLGLAVLSIAFAIVPLGQWTPYVGLVGGPIVGLIFGLLKLGGGAAVVSA